jgi:tRNA (guanine-N7-)-methyltransferase
LRSGLHRPADCVNLAAAADMSLVAGGPAPALPVVLLVVAGRRGGAFLQELDGRTFLNVAWLGPEQRNSGSCRPLIKIFTLKMGRRHYADRSALDLSRHLLALEYLAAWTPLPCFCALRGWRCRWDRQGPVPASEVAGRPGTDFWASRSAKYALFCCCWPGQSGDLDARVVAGDALRLFHELLPDESLAAVHVYFPDPWWKKRHKKRLHHGREAFVADVQCMLRPGGTLHFWTRRGGILPRISRPGWPRYAIARAMEVAESPAEGESGYRSTISSACIAAFTMNRFTVPSPQGPGVHRMIGGGAVGRCFRLGLGSLRATANSATK